MTAKKLVSKISKVVFICCVKMCGGDSMNAVVLPHAILPCFPCGDCLKSETLPRVRTFF